MEAIKNILDAIVIDGSKYKCSHDGYQTLLTDMLRAFPHIDGESRKYYTFYTSQQFETLYRYFVVKLRDTALSWKYASDNALMKYQGVTICPLPGEGEQVVLACNGKILVIATNVRQHTDIQGFGGFQVYRDGIYAVKS